MDGPVESKVKTATFAALTTAFIVAWIIQAVPVLASLNDALSALILSVVTAGITYLISFMTKHTPRNDAETRRDGVSDPIPPTDLV